MIVIIRDTKCGGTKVYINGDSFLVKDDDTRSLELLQKQLRKKND